MSTADSKTRNIALTQPVIVPYKGLPRDVKHADEVCISDKFIALIDIILTSLISNTLLSAASELKKSFVASGAKAYNATAQGRDIKKVRNMHFLHSLMASTLFLLSANGEIFGTLAAARPYAIDTGKLTIVTAQPE
jgi:hypothetical protein